MGVDNDQTNSEPTDEELALGTRIAQLARDPSGEARARIMAAVRNAPALATPSRQPIFAGGRWRFVLVGLATAGLLLAASAGALAASSDALPRSPAYRLRLIEENLRVAVADPREQPRLQLQFAAERARQAQEQIRLGDAGVAAELLSDCRRELSDAQLEAQATHDPAEELDLQAEHDSLQSEAMVEQAQVDAIVNSGDDHSPAPEASPTPGDPSGIPAEQVPASPAAAPEPSPGGGASPSADSTPAAPSDVTPTP